MRRKETKILLANMYFIDVIFFFHSSENFFRVVGLGILQSHKMLELVLSPIFQLQKPNLWEVK